MFTKIYRLYRSAYLTYHYWKFNRKFPKEPEPEKKSVPCGACGKPVIVPVTSGWQRYFCNYDHFLVWRNEHPGTGVSYSPDKKKS